MKVFRFLILGLIVTTSFLFVSCGELPTKDSKEDNDITITNNNIVTLPDNMSNPVNVTNTSDTDSNSTTSSSSTSSSDNNSTESNSASDNSSSSSRSSTRIINNNAITIYEFQMIQ